MFLGHLKITGLAMAQIFFLGGLGFLLVRKNLLSVAGLEALSRLVIQAIFPALIVNQMLKNFDFSLYPDWWKFPLLSIIISVSALGVGLVLLKISGIKNEKRQFLSLIVFQNSGYLPLAMVASIFSGLELNSIFIYIFLFLLGFDLLTWSLGVYMLTYEKGAKFNIKNIFSPPVIANLCTLSVIWLGLDKFIPAGALKPVEMLGNCTLPLAMITVGGNLALSHFKKIDKKAVFFFLLGKLFILPLIGIWVVLKLNFTHLFGFLVVMQLAVPSATSLSVIIRHYKREDKLISQGIFLSHIFGLLTIPLFLGLYLSLAVVK